MFLCCLSENDLSGNGRCGLVDGDELGDGLVDGIGVGTGVDNGSGASIFVYNFVS